MAIVAIVGLPYFWKKPRREGKKDDGEVTAHQVEKARKEDAALPSDKPSDVVGGARKDAQFAEKPATG